MARKSVLDLKEQYADQRWRDSFVEFFSLRILLSQGVTAPGYQPPDDFGRAISLTSEGEDWVPRIRSSIAGISVDEAKLALFSRFFHHDLFIDVGRADARGIRKALEAEMLGAKVRLPWVYGRVLYDRFHDLFPEPTPQLSAAETFTLLEGSPQGVFQLGNIVVGPFGVLNSCCRRLLPPTLSVPLWHCSDPSCNALHVVKLSTGASRVSQAVDLIGEECRGAEGPASEWDLFFDDIASPDYWYDDMHLQHLPWLLANGLSAAELRVLLRRLIERHPAETRERFPDTKCFARVLSGSPHDIADRLAQDQCFQLVLLPSSESIVEELERLIAEGLIHVPPTETRTARVTYGTADWHSTHVQCSRFGVRTVSESTNVCVARLKRLIEVLWKESDARAQLEWKLRHVDGDSSERKVEAHVHSGDPRRIVAELILASPRHLRQAFEAMRFGWFEVPSSSEDEAYLIDKILWKLGFDIGLYPRAQALFWERLEKLVDAARSCTSYNEPDREVIRSVGVNFFVSLEDVLDNSLSFATWALLSDHYGVTGFKCNLDNARRFMASRLSGLRYGSNEALQLDPGGKNTLYPLIQGFAVLADLCTSIVDGDSSGLHRPDGQLPGYHGQTDVQRFPFLHTALVLDLGHEDRARITALLASVTATLEGAQVHSIRNRLEHKRPGFPSRAEIEGACDAAAQAVNEMETSGLSPLVFLYSGSSSDRYGRTTVILEDYRGREIAVRRPSQYTLCGLPPLTVPQMIVASMHVGDSSELMRFAYVESSEYVDLWRDYPKRVYASTHDADP